jgi:hypothetical protein
MATDSRGIRVWEGDSTQLGATWDGLSQFQFVLRERDQSRIVPVRSGRKSGIAED